MKFNIGDRVKIIRDTCSHHFPIGSERTIDFSTGGYYSSGRGDKSGNFFKDDDAELLSSNLSSNKNTMNIKESFVLAFKREPEKTFRKLEITNGDDVLTEDGKIIFLSWLLKKFQDDFKKEVADQLLAEQEKK